MKLLKYLIATVVMLLFFFAPKLIFGARINYSDALVRGVYDEEIEIEYDSDIYLDKEVYSPTLSALNLFETENIDDTYVFGFDKKSIKGVLSVASNFTSQIPAEAGGEVSLTLPAGDKDNIIERQILILMYTRDMSNNGALYTNEVYVNDKNIGSTTVIKVKATNPALLIGTGYTSGPTGQTVTAPVLINCLGAVFPEYSGSVTPVHFGSRKIENWASLLKWPFAMSNATAKRNMYTKKTKKWQAEQDARDIFLMLKEKLFLWGEDAVAKHIANNNDPASTEFSKNKGLFYWIKNGGSPAISVYSDTEMPYSVWDEFQWSIFPSTLGDPGKRRMGIINDAMTRFFSRIKYDHPGYKLEDNDIFKMPGCKMVETESGGIIDLIPNMYVSELYSNKNKPFMAVVNPKMIKVYTHEKDYLAANIQAPDITGKKYEFRGGFTFLLHQADTAHVGLLTPSVPR